MVIRRKRTPLVQVIEKVGSQQDVPVLLETLLSLADSNERPNANDPVEAHRKASNEALETAIHHALEHLTDTKNTAVGQADRLKFWIAWWNDNAPSSCQRSELSSPLCGNHPASPAANGYGARSATRTARDLLGIDRQTDSAGSCDYFTHPIFNSRGGSLGVAMNFNLPVDEVYDPILRDTRLGVDPCFLLAIELERAVGDFNDQGDVLGAWMALQVISQATSDDHDFGFRFAAL